MGQRLRITDLLTASVWHVNQQTCSLFSGCLWSLVHYSQTQTKGMRLWLLQSHRNWQPGKKWRGRFSRIKWACLTFLIWVWVTNQIARFDEKRPARRQIGDDTSLSTSHHCGEACLAKLATGTGLFPLGFLSVWSVPLGGLPLHSVYMWFSFNSLSQVFMGRIYCSDLHLDRKALKQGISNNG
jgi:hypothetical protein